VSCPWFLPLPAISVLVISAPDSRVSAVANFGSRPRALKHIPFPARTLAASIHARVFVLIWVPAAVRQQDSGSRVDSATRLDNTFRRLCFPKPIFLRSFSLCQVLSSSGTLLDSILFLGRSRPAPFSGFIFAHALIDLGAGLGLHCRQLWSSILPPVIHFWSPAAARQGSAEFRSTANLFSLAAGILVLLLSSWF
jgi:hypothetical protein